MFIIASRWAKRCGRADFGECDNGNEEWEFAANSITRVILRA